MAMAASAAISCARCTRLSAHEIHIVAVNDLCDAHTNAHLTQYDAAHGKFPGEVSYDAGDIVVNGDCIKVCAERDPA